MTFFDLLKILFAGLIVVYAINADAAPTFSSGYVTPATASSPTSSQEVTELVTITFFQTSGTVSASSLCPTIISSAATTQTTNLPIGAVATTSTKVYDQNLNSDTIYPGYTCQILYTHYPKAGVSTAQQLATDYNIVQAPPANANATQIATAVASARDCSTKLPGAPPGMLCIQGPLTAINTIGTANTSICYNDFPANQSCTQTCESGQCPSGSTYHWLEAYINPGSVVANQTNISIGGSAPVPVPPCSANSPLMLYLSSASVPNYTFTYTRSIGLAQSYSGQHSTTSSSPAPAATCTSFGCPSLGGIAGRNLYCYANYSCSSGSVTITQGVKNQIGVAQTPPNTIAATSGNAPYIFLTGPVCSISGVISSSPISP